MDGGVDICLESVGGLRRVGDTPKEESLGVVDQRALPEVVLDILANAGGTIVGSSVDDRVAFSIMGCRVDKCDGVDLGMIDDG